LLEARLGLADLGLHSPDSAGQGRELGVALVELGTERRDRLLQLRLLPLHLAQVLLPLLGLVPYLCQAISKRVWIIRQHRHGGKQKGQRQEDGPEPAGYTEGAPSEPGSRLGVVPKTGF